MVRFVIIGIVIAVAFTLYALVDAAMTESSRARGVAKPVWVVLIVVLPVIGAVLWFLIGKGAVPSPAQARAAQAPDDDPRFSGKQMSSDALDDHMKDLEARLKELDDEVFPGEREASPASEAEQPGSAARGAADASAESDAPDSRGATGATGASGANGAGQDPRGSGSTATQPPRPGGDQNGTGRGDSRGTRPDGDAPRP